LRLPAVGASVDEFLGFSHAGRWLAARCKDGRGWVWDLEKRALVLTQPMSGRAEGMAFRCDEQQLAVADGERSTRILELAAGELIRSITTLRGPELVAYSPDGRWLAVAEDNGSAESRVDIFAADSGALVTNLLHPQALTGLGWHPDNRRLATTCYDRQVRLWDALAGRELHVLPGHGEEIHGIAFHPGGELLMSSGFDNAILWQVQTGERLFTLPGMRLYPKFASSGDRFYTRGFLAAFDVWEITCNAPVRALGSEESFFGQKAVAFSPDGKVVVFGDGRRLRWFTAHTGREIGQVELGEPASLHFDAHGQLWSSGRFGVRCCSLHPGAAPGEWALSPPRAAFEAGSKGAAALSRDGRFLAVPYAEHCRVFRTDTGQEVARTPGQRPSDYCAFSPDNRWLVTGGYRYNEVAVWEMIPGQTNLQRETTLLGDHSWGGVPRFSPDGARLAAHWGGHLAFYDTAGWKALWTHPVEDHSVFAHAPNGQLLALRTDKCRIHLLAPEDGAVLATLEMPNGMAVQTIDFSPDSTMLAAASASTSELFVWDLGAVRRELMRLGLDWSQPPTQPANTINLGNIQHPTSNAQHPMVAQTPVLEGSTKPVTHSLTRTNQEPLPTMDCAPEWWQQRRAALAGKIPPRDPKTAPPLLDLSGHYNFALAEAAPIENPGNDLASLPTGIQRLANVDFDVRGGIQLRGKERPRGFPTQVGQIPIGRSCRRLHFLCAFRLGTPEGTRVGTLVMRQGQGLESELPLLSGRNLSDWWSGNDASDDGGPVVAWTGQNAAATRARCHLHLFKVTWENPRPGLPVESFTFRSELTDSGPFLLAVTAEP
jgi:WD40 repeat protein